MAVGLLYTILRFGFVALLWLLVIGLTVVLRRDISLAATASGNLKNLNLVKANVGVALAT